MLGKNQHIKIRIVPMMYKVATPVREDMMLTNYPHTGGDIKTFSAFRNVYFPLQKTDEEFFNEYRAISMNTFIKLETARERALHPELAVEEVVEEAPEQSQDEIEDDGEALAVEAVDTIETAENESTEE